VAYVVPAAASPTAAELRAFLSARLPDYMLPAAYVMLPALPLTANGKIDRKALPEPGSRCESERHMAPRDAFERELVEIWETLLSARPIGIDDGFFEIGGHSLLAVRLTAEIDKRFGRRLPISRIFESPTIAGLASVLREGEEIADPSCLVKIRPRGSRAPLVFLPGTGGMVGYLYPLAQHLCEEIPFFSFQARGVDGKSAPHASIEEMAADYVALLIEEQPQGPYFLGGHSLGGQVAFAMAQMLLARGYEVGLVAIVDAYAPGAEPEVAGETAPGIEGADSLLCLLNVLRAQLGMRLQGSPESSLAAPITLFRASEARAGEPPEGAPGEDLGWGRYSSRPVPIHFIPGNHMTMMRPPGVGIMAQLLEEAIRSSSGDSERRRTTAGVHRDAGERLLAGGDSDGQPGGNLHRLEQLDLAAGLSLDSGRIEDQG
jgi:thioesterase domain-containing protein/acyl carrier protein